MNIFCDDFDFIDEVAEAYVQFIPEGEIPSHPEYMELCILLGQYVPSEHPNYEFYTTRLENYYCTFLLYLKLVKGKMKGVSELGFSILISDYKGRKNILDYFAGRLMDELYHKNHCGSFEDLIHKHCESPQNIEVEGYEQFFVRSLYGVDKNLSYYVFENPHLLCDLIDELDEICENWYEYEDELSFRCVEIIKDWVSKKENENAYGDDFDYTQVMNEVIVSMNFGKMFGLDRKQVAINTSRIISFGSARFKQDLKEVINKVLMERLTLSELNNLKLDEEEPDAKKVLKP